MFLKVAWEKVWKWIRVGLVWVWRLVQVLINL